MIIVRFYLIVVGALGAGCLTAFDKNENVVAAVIAGFGAIVSELFERLDRRTRQLIDASKAALRRQQAVMATETGIEEMNIVARADDEDEVDWTYTRVFRAVFRSATAAFVFAALLGLGRAGEHVLPGLWVCLAAAVGK